MNKMNFYNVENVLTRLGIDYEIKGDEAFAPCPQHKQRTGHADRNPSWSISLSSGLHFCFSCHYRGGLVRLVSDLHGSSYRTAEEWVADDFDPGSLQRYLTRAKVVPYMPSPPRPKEAVFLALSDPSEEALASRYLTREVVERYGVKHDGESWYFPFRDMLGQYFGYQRKNGKTVRNVPYGLSKSKFLFGEHIATASRPIVVVESPLDAMLAYTHGHQAVALYGSRASDMQVNSLSSHPVVILALDNDSAGDHGSLNLYSHLCSLTVVKRVMWPEGVKDFGDAPDKVADIILSAKDPLQIKLDSYA